MKINNLFLGKINRTDYIYRLLGSSAGAIAIIFCLVLLMNYPLTFFGRYQFNYQMPGIIITALLTQIYHISLIIRRLRDIKQSPWLALVVLAKPLDAIAILTLMVIPSK